jgi:hypothetical protein
MSTPRNLTDDDVDAVVEALGKKLKQEFYEDLGRGVFAVAWKVVVGVIIALAAVGSHSGWFK